eukprot:1720645-Ditylum_brightwellii.AAC.1
MAPTTQGVHSAYKITTDNIAPLPLIHQEHNIGGEGDEGDMEEAMVQKKVSTRAQSKGVYFCPLKPMQWLQGANAFPYTQEGKACVHLTWG